MVVDVAGWANLRCALWLKYSRYTILRIRVPTSILYLYGSLVHDTTSKRGRVVLIKSSTSSGGTSICKTGLLQCSRSVFSQVAQSGLPDQKMAEGYHPMVPLLNISLGQNRSSISGLL
eukprot:scaffold22560_cov135-Cylindrotheca_fusiformis.AAC.68